VPRSSDRVETQGLDLSYPGATRIGSLAPGDDDVNIIATKRQYSPLERWLTCAAARPIAQEVSAQVNGSREESQGLTAGLVDHDVAGEEPRAYARGFYAAPPEMTVSTGPLAPDGARCWMTSHDLTATGTPASGPAHRDGDAWKEITFVCHMPRLSAEERQHLFATWSNEYHGS
jgi:hypothetical protein